MCNKSIYFDPITHRIKWSFKMIMSRKCVKWCYTAALFFVASSLAQEISGKVVDENQNPLIGANVSVESERVGAATDLNGDFSFPFVPEDNFTLIVSYIGYQTERRSMKKDDSLTGLEFVLVHGNLFGKEVTVFARIREETIKEVPISMVAIRKETITDIGASSLEDLTAVVPNVFTYDEQTATSFNIRGITGGTRNPGMAPAEGVYFDGVIMGRPNFIVSDIVDIQSVEFLRGPQGTLFGRNTVSGAINMITVKPSPINSMSLLAEKGKWGYLKLKGSANYKLTDGLYTRLSGYTFDYDGYLTNTANNTREKYKNNIGGRIALRSIPSPKLTVDLSLDYYQEDLSQMGEHISDWRISSQDPMYNDKPLDSIYYAMDSIDISDENIYTFTHDTAGYWHRDLKGMTINTNYSINDDLHLVSVFSYRASTLDYFNDEDGTGLDLMTGKWDNLGKQSTFEFRLVSNSNSRLTWLSGVFYYNLYERLLGPVYPKPLWLHFATGYPLIFINNFYAGATVKPEGKGNTVSVGTYASIDYVVSKKISLTVGARYSYDSKHFKYRQEGFPEFGYVHVPADSNGNLIGGYFDSTKTWSAITPTFNLKYVVSPYANIFGTISRGYKSGGFNTDYVSSLESVATPFRPEYITNYELGIKAGNRTNSLFVNGAVFHMEYKDMQISQFQDVFEGYMISNAASSTISGLELDFSMRLLNNALTLMGGYGRIEAVFNKFHDGYFNGYWDAGEEYTDGNGNSQYDEGEDFIDEDEDFSGKHISTYPKQSWSLIADFRMPVTSKIMFISQVRSDFIDEKLAQLSTDKDANLLRDDARTLVNGHLGIETESWGVFAWGENLLNTEYILGQGVNGYLGFIEQVWGQPRLFGLRFTYKL